MKSKNCGKMITDENQQVQHGIERIRKVRGGHRAVVKKLGREACRLIKEHGEQREKDLISRLHSIEITLNEKRILLDKLNDQVLEQCEETDIEKEIEETTELWTLINEWIDRIKQFKNNGNKGIKESVPLQSLETTDTPIVSQQEETQDVAQQNENLNTSVSNESTSSRIFSGVRLPKINLPRFNGDITKYQNFIQSFKCSIDENETLSCVNKLNYLINAMEGPAYKSLEGLQIIEENYQNAMDILKERYGKPQHILSVHMQELLSLQNDRKTELRTIYDKIMVHVRGLESLGISSEKYGSLLTPVILSRIPSEIALQVARKTSEDIWSIEDIMNIIRREIVAREVSSKVSVKDSKKYEKPAKNLPIGTTKTFVTKFDKSKQSIECYFCSKDHYLSSCKEVTDPNERKAIINAAKRCYNCLRIGHNAKDCRQTRRCYHCNGKHNTELCTIGTKNSIPKPSTSITTSSITEKTEVLLQTATTYAYGGDSNKKVPVNILFDCGSQKTFVSEELQKKLNLKSDNFELLNLNSFGSEQYVKMRCERVEISLEVSDAVVKISALSSAALCSPVSSRVDISSYPHLKGLSLAKGVGTAKSRIDILVGADHYYDIVIGDVIRSSGGPVAINSKLGWLLSGHVSCYSDNVSTCNNINSNLVLDILPSREEVVDQTNEIISSVDRFWKHEAMEIESNESMETPNQLYIKFKEKDQRYEVCLPWKNDFEGKCESNYQLCKSRLFSLYKKLRENPELMKQYDDVFKEQLMNGVIEQVKNQGVESDSKAHFLCHFGVARQERETTKLRVVFDGSAKANIDSLSLNDRLEVGANHKPLLFDTIIRFRLHSIAIIADIEKAFLQVQINESGRDMVLFLWFDDIGKENPAVVEYRYCRLVFGLTCSPSILAETIKHHVSQFPNEDSKILNALDKLYCDDLSCGIDTREEAINL